MCPSFGFGGGHHIFMASLLPLKEDGQHEDDKQ